MSDHLQDLLGDDVVIDGLDEESAARLATLIAESRDRQSAALDQAIDDGLRNLPRLLRGPVKKVLFR